MGEVGDIDQLFFRPSPFGELCNIETARHNDTVKRIAIKAKHAMDRCLNENQSAQRCGILDAFVERHIVDASALAALADLVVGQHLIGRTGKFKVVRRHDRRNSSLFQNRKNRRR